VRLGRGAKASYEVGKKGRKKGGRMQAKGAKKSKKEDVDDMMAEMDCVDKGGYEYPEKLVHPSNFWLGFVAPALHGTTVQLYETPIAVYQTMRLDQIMWNCIAAYHTTALDSITLARPSHANREPDAAKHTSQNRVLCSAHAINGLLQGGLNPDAVDVFAGQMKDQQLDNSVPTDAELRTSSTAPYYVGHRLANEMLAVMRRDGSNFDGATTRRGTPCPPRSTCPIYGDSGSGYAPKNSPWVPSGETLDLMSWVPHLETNGRGMVSSTGHITPHFGAMDTLIVDKQEHLSTHGISNTYPTDNAGMKAKLKTTMDRVARTVQTAGGREIVQFFDNKINLAGGMIMRMRERFSMSFEEQVYYHVGYTTAEYDSVVFAWRAKLSNDRARPTALVNSEQFGYAGTIQSFDGQGFGPIGAKDWDAVIRVMPHAEYPSGSGCICTVVAEYVEKFYLEEKGLADGFATQWEVAEGVTLQFRNMMELRDACGESRIDGGMHFEDAVADSYALCKDIGIPSYLNYVQLLLGANNPAARFADVFLDPVAYPMTGPVTFVVPEY
jgi:hypothetical protein